MAQGGADAPRERFDPFDPAYRFDDIDEFVRNAQQRGMEVLITLWGTRAGRTAARSRRRCRGTWPTSRRSAARSRAAYSGRFSGYPFVRFFSIWNESNLATFLVPQSTRRPDREPAELRAARRSGLRGHQGRQRTRAGRRRRDVVERA